VTGLPGLVKVFDAPAIINLILKRRGVWWSRWRISTNSINELLVGHDLSNDTLEVSIGERVRYGNGIEVISYS